MIHIVNKPVGYATSGGHQFSVKQEDSIKYSNLALEKAHALRIVEHKINYQFAKLDLDKHKQLNKSINMYRHSTGRQL